MNNWDLEVDLVVIGAGMAGLTTAASAASRGARVVVIEKTREIGGSAALSGGFLWTMQSHDLMRERIPLGDSDLQRIVIEDYPRVLEWVRSTGVHVGSRSVPRNVPAGAGHIFDVLAYLRACRRMVEASDGFVLLGAHVTQLAMRGPSVAGVIVDTDGESSSIGARWTAMATGGFQADPAMRVEYIGAHAEDILLRSNPNSTGDGVRLGISAGAALTSSTDGYYGHPIASPAPDPFTPSDFGRLSQSSYAPFAVLVNRDGRRFVDESRGHPTQSQVLARELGKRAALIADERLRSTYATQAQAPGVEVVDRPAEAERSGARVASADSLDSLADVMAEWGYDAARVVETVVNFNRAVTEGEDLDPPRRWNRDPIIEAPFFAVEVEPSITFTHGGIRIDGGARALDAAGVPIEGLLAVGADGAGVHNGGYAGGLAVGGVFGLRAADAVIGERRRPA